MAERGSPQQRLREQRDASLRSQLDKESLAKVLRRVEDVNRRFGFLAWDPERLAEDSKGDPGPQYPRLRPPTPEAPRLFVSYGWSRDETHQTYESDLWTDAFAGSLFNAGYDIWFDRDPRNFDKGLNWFQVLSRMNDCNYFIPILTDSYVERISSPRAAGPLVAEWQQALRLFPKYLTIIAIWHSGSKLPAELPAANVVDIRDNPAPWGGPLDAMFPPAAPGAHGIPKLPPPDRPPDPEHWPKYQPY